MTIPENNKKDAIYNCRVCGFNQGFEPWGEDGNTPTFAICDCCGVKFGVGDCTLEAIHAFREQWLSNGAKWKNPYEKPDHWSLGDQMISVPMKKKIETTWNELVVMANILNEVCHGIGVNDFQTKVGFNYEEIFFLLRKMGSYSVSEDAIYSKIVIELNKQDIEILTNCLILVLTEIEEWEFAIRIGVSTEEANKIRKNLANQVL